LAKAVFDKAALTGKYLDGWLTAVLASHDPFDVFEQDRTDAAVIVKLLAAIVNSYPRPRADVLVISTFIRVLKTSPEADVVDQNCLKVGCPRFHFQHQRLQSVTTVHS
jgi:hypothetical protein